MELSWAKRRSLMASAEKKAADTIVALMVTDIITALVPLERAQVDTSTTELANLPEPAPVLQETEGAEGEEQPKED